MVAEKTVFAVLIVFLLAGGASGGTYSGGMGEPNNPYKIATPNDLNDIGNHPNDWGSHFVMVNDVNLAEYTGTQFNIIGIDYENAFTGVFDGNGHTISNFTYTITDADYIGLFAYIAGGAEIKNLGLIDVNVMVVDSNSSDSYRYDYAGSLVGFLINGTVSSCWAEGGSVSGDWRVGGLVGGNGGHIKDSYTRVTVLGDVGDGYVGGLVGYNFPYDEGQITASFATSLSIFLRTSGSPPVRRTLFIPIPAAALVTNSICSYDSISSRLLHTAPLSGIQYIQR